MKKVFSVLTAVLMLVCFCVPAFAAGSTDPYLWLTVENKTYNTVTVTLNAASGKDLAGLVVFLTYPADKLTFVSGEFNSGSYTLGECGKRLGHDDQISISYAAANSTDGGKLCAVTFKCTGDAGAKLDLKLTCQSIAFISGSKASFSDASKIVVAGVSTTIPKPVSLYVGGKAQRTYKINAAKAPDYTGLVVKARYDAGGSKTLAASEYTLTTDFNGAKAGTYKVNAALKSDAVVTASYDVVVYEQAAKTLTVTTAPSKTKYTTGSDTVIDLTGLTLTAVMDDGSSKPLTASDCIITAPDFTVSGVADVYVEYNGASTSFKVTVSPAYLLGDVDSDGSVTAADARLALRIAVALDKASAVQTLAADADKDGSITAADARLILRCAVGLESL